MLETSNYLIGFMYRMTILDGTIKTLEVRCQENIDDMFTKILPKASLGFFIVKLRVISKKSLKG